MDDLYTGHARLKRKPEKYKDAIMEFEFLTAHSKEVSEIMNELAGSLEAARRIFEKEIGDKGKYWQTARKMKEALTRYEDWVRI